MIQNIQDDVSVCFGSDELRGYLEDARLEVIAR